MPNPYKSLKYPHLTVDTLIRDGRGRIVLVQRGRPPFKGRWGLPGGFCEWKETTEDCARRETLEETGLRVRLGALLGVYSKPDRDPRGHNVTILYDATPTGGRLQGGDDAADARWFTRAELRKVRFAFDHDRIVSEQLGRRARRRETGRPSRGRRGASRG